MFRRIYYSITAPQNTHETIKQACIEQRCFNIQDNFILSMCYLTNDESINLDSDGLLYINSN